MSIKIDMLMVKLRKRKDNSQEPQVVVRHVQFGHGSMEQGSNMARVGGNKPPGRLVLELVLGSSLYVIPLVVLLCP